MPALCVIPTYVRSEEDLAVVEKTFETLRSQEPDAEVLAVDDFSPAREVMPGLREAAGRYRVRLHEKDENSGFSRTVNVGLREALGRGLDAVLVNADIEFKMPFVRAFEGTADSQGRPAAVVGALLLYDSGLIQHAGIFFSFMARAFDHRFRYGPGALPEALVPHVCPVTGALQYVRHSTLETVGLYDEAFSMGYEDVDYCVSGDTPVLTSDGWASTASLAGTSKMTATIDGAFRTAQWFYVGEADTFNVNLSDGTVIRATAGHRWPVVKSSSRTEWVTTRSLCGRRLYRPSVSFGVDLSSEMFREGVVHGFTFGDGTVNTGRQSAKCVTYPSSPAKQRFVMEWFPKWSEYRTGLIAGRGLPAAYKSLPTDQDNTYLAGFIAGLVAADGHAVDRLIRLSNKDEDVLCEVRAMLLSMGIHVGPPRQIHQTHNNFTGMPRMTAELTLPVSVVQSNPWLALRPDQKPIPGKWTARRTVEVISVTPAINEPVFCCSEPETHSWVTAGSVATGNCLRVFDSDLECVYQPAVRAVHHESMFRGERTEKLDEWHQKSLQHLHDKHAQTPLHRFVPTIA